MYYYAMIVVQMYYYPRVVVQMYHYPLVVVQMYYRLYHWAPRGVTNVWGVENTLQKIMLKFKDQVFLAEFQVYR